MDAPKGRGMSISSKRTLTWLVAIVAVFALLGTACSDDNKDSTSTDNSSSDNTSAANAPSVDYGSLSGTLTGSGATFPKPFYEEAITEFMAVGPNLEVTYAGGGSGQGKSDLQDGVVDWAGSDSLIKDEDLPDFQGTVLYFPTVAAPITVSYNLSGVDKLQLTPDTLAKIFQRDITTWDDSEIADENPDADLPSTDITVAHRSDGSGTTKNFTTYLESAAPDTWTLGSGDTVDWAADTQAGNGNPGVASIVKDTDGAIGYVDLSDAKASGLTFAAIQNKSGEYVEPTLDGASAALAGAEINDDLTYNPLNADGADAYPITAPTWIIVYETQSDQAHVDNIVGWLTYILTDAQDFANDLDYARLPDSLQQQAIAQLDKITAG
jgi:phosphate transport system substrate-binding protein